MIDIAPGISLQHLYGIGDELLVSPPKQSIDFLVAVSSRLTGHATKNFAEPVYRVSSEHAEVEDCCRG